MPRAPVSRAGVPRVMVPAVPAARAGRRADGPFRDGPAPFLDDGLPEWAFPDDRPAGGGDWWPAEDFEEPWPDYAAMTPVMRARRRAWTPAWTRGSCPGCGAGPAGRAGSGFTSGHAFDTSLPGRPWPALDAAPAPGNRNLDDDELIGVLAGWQKTEAWAAAGGWPRSPRWPPAAPRPPILKRPPGAGHRPGRTDLSPMRSPSRSRCPRAVCGADGPAGARPGYPAAAAEHRQALADGVMGGAAKRS